ncbi:MAG: GNAT family N-acetyltransferase [Pseudomonadota bacterium]
MPTTYETEWQRQLARTDIPPNHLPVHRWYLRHDDPASIAEPQPPRDDLSIIRATNPSVAFYRFLYHTAGENFLWGDRRRMSDADILNKVDRDDIHVMVLYRTGTPAGFYELDCSRDHETEIKYFALLPGFIGGGLGRFMLNAAIAQAGERSLPLIVDTCTLDHPVALENYKARGFSVYGEQDEEYDDPRKDGTVPPDAGSHLPPGV